MSHLLDVAEGSYLVDCWLALSVLCEVIIFFVTLTVVLLYVMKYNCDQFLDAVL